MTCYFKHLNDVFSKAGIQVNRENEKEIDRTIRQIVGVTEGGCPLVWKEVKKALAENEDAFTLKLRDAWKKHEG